MHLSIILSIYPFVQDTPGDQCYGIILALCQDVYLHVCLPYILIEYELQGFTRSYLATLEISVAYQCLISALLIAIDGHFNWPYEQFYNSWTHCFMQTVIYYGTQIKFKVSQVSFEYAIIPFTFAYFMFYLAIFCIFYHVQVQLHWSSGVFTFRYKTIKSQHSLIQTSLSILTFRGPYWVTWDICHCVGWN